MFNLRGRLYRVVMKVAHKYHWHYAPPSYPDGETLLWCHWCGFRQAVPRMKGEKLEKLK